MVGFLDMASNITAGIRETTTVFEGGDINRERLPRYTGKDCIVTVSVSVFYFNQTSKTDIHKSIIALFSKRSFGSNVAQGNGKWQIFQ